MSYDISMGDMNRNYTSNVYEMWDRACPNINLRDMSGKLGMEVSGELSVGILDMINREDSYKQLEPDNGWGDYQGALSVLVELYINCVRYPYHTIHVWH